MEYVEAHFQERRGHVGSVGVKILISIGREVSERESLVIRQKSEEIEKALLEETIRLNPERQERADGEKRNLLALFPDPIFVEEIPNGYCSDYCCKHLPWFVVTTRIGRIKIGWRKRVIAIDWSDTLVTRTAMEIFPSEDVTKIGQSIHAWGYEKANAYLKVLLTESRES